MRGMLKEFMDFVKKQNVVALALGLVIGFAAKTLIDALVADLISPLYTPYLGFGSEAVITIGLSNFKVGHFIEALISFLVILFVAFIIGRQMGKKK
jgi:large conductance mechanosensitive channel